MIAIPPRRPRGAAAALLRCCALAAGLVAVAAPTAHAVSIPDRTSLLTGGYYGEASDGGAQSPFISANGRIVIFDSTATNLVPEDRNGPIRDVFAMDRVSGTRVIVSAGSPETGADGPSTAAVSSADGSVIVFTSEATNLVAGDTNGVADVFARRADGSIVRVSHGVEGAEANGASYQPDVSENGRFVVFTSEATNLAPEDTNGVADVFVVDLATLATGRVSLGTRGQANARSSSPAISANGRVVAFESAATNLVPSDTNGVADVFVVELARRGIERVSVGDNGQQNRAVSPPFLQVPDLSEDGRYVVFESDATNLVEDDANRRTDVFRRDRERDDTLLVSASTDQVQGNNDSFGPRITASGGFVTFQSFASNLVQGDDGPREDVFVRDLRRDATSVISVTSDGSPRQAEVLGQVLQRPAISASGTIAAFASSAPNLVPGDDNGLVDVFLRRLDAPEAALAEEPKVNSRPLIKVRADDPRATRFLCQVDKAAPVLCGSIWRVPRLPEGRHTVSVRAGGPGLLWSRRALRVPITVRFPRGGGGSGNATDRTRPTVRIRAVRRTTKSIRLVRGSARDRGGSGLEKVQVAVTYLAKADGTCEAFDGKRFVKASCKRRLFVDATGTTAWQLRLPKSIKGPIAIYARATDKAGNRSRTATRSLVLA